MINTSAKDLKDIFSTKKEMMKVFNLEGYYLPTEKECNYMFFKNILEGKKKVNHLHK